MKKQIRNSEQLYVSMKDAIGYIREHANQQPSAEEVAKAIGMSPSRFEHAFAEWAGISPKRFLAHLTKERAKQFLLSKDVLKSAHASGLSGPGRLHGLMVTMEAVSPGEFKSGDIEIAYGIHLSPFGWCLIGITKRGICHLSFVESNNEHVAIKQLEDYWPKAKLIHDQPAAAAMVSKIFSNKNSKGQIRLLVKGTNFQIKVWEALLRIPDGKVSNYLSLAKAAGFPKAVRAAGSACGKNSIAYLIPCHRVLASNGKIGGYHWGTDRKEAILAWESARGQK